ncbi:zinc-binding dehydrogenase [Echinicola jeungdonensis]|uniref:Zinc-binding dehydrogenase n=1 Tax=Echinicola jeungdonensis TaxID=709343 RepID=A0ABV5J055_9BACT|nr:zinc-binding dehydrogenase [Echinicola jeungdonensis]MDN3671184.1 zinc-binding dehydrogenase [Echinicola jeungdonensis]
MKGIVLNSKHPDKIEIKEVELPRLKPHEVKVKIKAAALNHRDEWCRRGLYPARIDGVVLGSDGTGVVEEIGELVEKDWLGKDVIINPAKHWGNSQKAQSEEFQILGMPEHGTFAEYVQVPADRLKEKPLHLKYEEAAALPLGGLTAYRAVFTQGKISEEDKVLVTGFGGGVAQFAAQYAIAAGAKVYVNSSKEEKIRKAISLGAHGGFNYKDKVWAADAISQIGGFDLIIDGTAGDTFDDLTKILNPGGRLIFYGATLGNPSSINARRVFWNQLTIQGSTMGSDHDFEEMVNFVQEKKVIPVVDSVRPYSNAIEAFEKMSEGAQMGKLVLTF